MEIELKHKKSLRCPETNKQKILSISRKAKSGL